MSKLEVGMTFVSTLEMCNYMGFKYNERHPEYNRLMLSDYCEWHKITRRKIIIDKVYDEKRNDFKMNQFDFRFNVGDVVNVHSGQLLILEQIKINKSNKNGDYQQKGYVCKCLNDGYEFPLLESKILNNRGCSVCANRIVVKGVNDIATTNPELVKLFKLESDAFKYTVGSSEKVWFKCPHCGNEKFMSIVTVSTYGMACNKCSDGISYPEKFIINLLNQLNLSYLTQYNKLYASWCNKYKYDFAILSKNCIIETHGMQHYEENTKFNMTLCATQDNDKTKKQLAIANGIEYYIVLDCRYSELEWIKKSVMKSDLPNIFNFKENDVDWLNCHTFALNSLVKQVSNYKNTHVKSTSTDIGKIFNLSRGAVNRYLKTGNKLGWCVYDALEEMKNSDKMMKTKYQKYGIPIKCLETNHVFGKISICEEMSNKLFGYKINHCSIKKVVDNIQKNTHNLHFQYITREEFNTIKTQSPELAFGDFLI